VPEIILFEFFPKIHMTFFSRHRLKYLGDLFGHRRLLMTFFLHYLLHTCTRAPLPLIHGTPELTSATMHVAERRSAKIRGGGPLVVVFIYARLQAVQIYFPSVHRDRKR